MKIQQAIDLFLLNKKLMGLAEKTLKDYRKSLNFLVSCTGVKDTDELTKQVFNSFVLCNMHKKPVTLNKYIRDCRVFIYWLQAEELTKVNYKIHCVKSQETAPQFYSDEELQRLVEWKTPKNFYELRTWAMVVFALGTGCRISTICSMLTEDIDFEKNLIHIREQKNKLYSSIPMSPKLAYSLKKYLAFVQCYVTKQGQFLFSTLSGEQLHPQGAYEALRDYSHNRNVGTAKWHNFRRNFARNWCLAGGDIFRLSTMLGHSDIAVTRKYVRLYGNELKNIEQYSVLEKII